MIATLGRLPLPAAGLLALVLAATLAAGRGALIDGTWPHQSAVIEESKNKRAYAVDSWFEDNGRAAHVVPLEGWRAGWSPPGFSDSIL